MFNVHAFAQLTWISAFPLSKGMDVVLVTCARVKTARGAATTPPALVCIIFVILSPMRPISTPMKTPETGVY